MNPRYERMVRDMASRGGMQTSRGGSGRGGSGRGSRGGSSSGRGSQGRDNARMDYARGGRGRDRAMDGRNPYGSRGGDVTSRRSRRDRAMEDYGYDYDMDYDYEDEEYDELDGNYGRSLYGYYGDTPFGIRRSYDMRGGRDYGYDYDDGEMLSNEDLKHWEKKLMGKMDEKDREMFGKEKVMKKAEMMGVKFEEFTPEEFYVTVLMVYTDYCKTLGSANMDLYLKLAKDWLMDEDASVKAGEKLMQYHDNIVMDD